MIGHHSRTRVLYLAFIRPIFWAGPLASMNQKIVDGIEWVYQEFIAIENPSMIDRAGACALMATFIDEDKRLAEYERL